MDLIDRKIALEILKELHGEQVVSKYFTHEQCQRTRNDILMAYNEIHSMPTVDAVEVVHCEDCEYYSRSGFCRNGNITGNCDCDLEKEPNGYCDWGERKGGD